MNGEFIAFRRIFNTLAPDLSVPLKGNVIIIRLFGAFCEIIVTKKTKRGTPAHQHSKLLFSKLLLLLLSG